MKAALRATRRAWSSLYGELSFDDLLVTQTIREVNPEAFTFLHDEIVREGGAATDERPTDEGGEEAAGAGDRRERWRRAVADSDSKDQKAMASPLGYLVGWTPDGESTSPPAWHGRVQGVHNRIYCSRAWEERATRVDRPGDQEVLSAMLRSMKRAASSAEADNEARLLASALETTAGFAPNFEYFQLHEAVREDLKLSADQLAAVTRRAMGYVHGARAGLRTSASFFRLLENSRQTPRCTLGRSLFLGQSDGPRRPGW